MIKRCSKCGGEFPATSEYFRKEKRSTDGFNGKCKRCCSEYYKQYRHENAFTISEKNKQWREANQETIIKYRKQYYQENRDYIIEWSKRYHQNNKGISSERRKRNYIKNREVEREQNKRYCQENQENLRLYRQGISAISAERNKQWRLNNKDRCLTHKHNRRARVLSLPHTLTSTQWETIKSHFGNSCAYCGKELPLEQEHFVPLTKGGEYTHNNIIPACRSCNNSKHVTSFFEWYPRQKFYSKEREDAILSYLCYKDNVQQLSLM